MNHAAPGSRNRATGRLCMALWLIGALFSPAADGTAGDHAPAEAPSQPPQPEQAAYLELVRADAARDAGLPAEALNRYTRALSNFRELAEALPDHMPKAIAYRIRYCEQEIESIRSDHAAQTATASVDALREIRQLRHRVAELEAALDRARGGAERAASALGP